MTLCSVARLAPYDSPCRLVATGSKRRVRASAHRVDVAPLPRDVACASLVDPHDETLEIEITEDMVNLALEAVDEQLVWPYAAERRWVARPCRQAQIIRFPGC